MNRLRGLTVAAALLAMAVGMPAAAGGDEGAVALDQHGRSHLWRGPTGRLTLIEFAASWCAPCRRTLPRLEAFARRHPDLRVLVVSVDDRPQGRDELVEALQLSLPMLWDESHRIAGHYQPPAMPTALLLSPAGDVLHTAPGSRTDDWEELAARIEEELRRNPAAGAAEQAPGSR